MIKTKTFTAKAGKKYHVYFDAGFMAGDTEGTSYITISSANMDGIDQYGFEKTLIYSIGSIKVEEVTNNAKPEKIEVYNGTHLLELDGKGGDKYEAYVGSDMKSVKVAVVAEDPDAMVSIEGESAKNSLKKIINLKEGENTITVKVTAPNGTSSSTSEIKIIKSSDTGQKKWSKSYNEVSELAADRSGVIYAGVSKDSKSYLLALNSDGTEKWKYSASDSVIMPVVGVDGTVYASCGTKIIAVSPKGKLKWQYDVGSNINKNIVVGKDKNIYFGVFAGYKDELLFALKPDGSKLWSFKTGSVYCEFAVGEDNSFYYTTWDYFLNNNNTYTLHALKSDRTEKWEYALDDQPNGLVIGKNDTLFLRSSNTLLAVAADEGTKLWDTQFDNSLNDIVVSSDGTIYTDSTGVLYAMNTDGSKKWESKMGENLYDMTISSDGNIYVPSEDHKIYVVDAEGSKQQEFLMTAESYYAPIIMDDGMVCASTSDNKIYAFGN